MTDSIAAVVKDMRNSIAHDGYRTVSTRCAPYTMVEEWADRLDALSHAGSGLTANSEPVAWLLIHRTRGFSKIVISEKTADSWHGWNKHPLYTTPPPAVDVGKLRENNDGD